MPLLYKTPSLISKTSLFQPRGSRLPEKQVVQWKPISEQRVLVAFHHFDKRFSKTEIIVLLVHCEANCPHAVTKNVKVFVNVTA